MFITPVRVLSLFLVMHKISVASGRMTRNSPIFTRRNDQMAYLCFFIIAT